MDFNFVLAFLCIISSALAQSSDGDLTTTPITPGYCPRDIVITIDGTLYMKSKENVLAELNFIEDMISNWTFGNNGVNVAFVGYGFEGSMTFTDFFTNFSSCHEALSNFRNTLNNTPALVYTNLTS